MEAYRNPVLHYLAVLKAARDFGVPQDQLESVAGPFDPTRVRAHELAHALADLVLARQAQA